MKEGTSPRKEVEGPEWIKGIEGRRRLSGGPLSSMAKSPPLQSQVDRFSTHTSWFLLKKPDATARACVRACKHFGRRDSRTHLHARRITQTNEKSFMFTKQLTNIKFFTIRRTPTRPHDDVGARLLAPDEDRSVPETMLKNCAGREVQNSNTL